MAAAVGALLVVVHRSHSHNTAGRPLPTVSPTAAGATATPASGTSSSSSSAAGKPARTVHVTALESDGSTYGIGMPIVLYFRPMPRDPSAFEHAVSVTVDGRPAGGAWYWEQPDRDEVRRHIVEAHYRPPAYWPADSQVHVAIPIGGLSAGPGLTYSNRLTSLNFRIGDAHVSTVDASTLTMRVTSNGQLAQTFEVSLGKAATPTYNGVKVVMQKGEDDPGTGHLRPNGTVLMSGPHYTGDAVQWSVRITRDGEYVHAAPWNGVIGQRSTSNGCTNLHTADARWFYNFSQLGDVVEYRGTDGTLMPHDDGLGDWNVPWPQWQQGGLLPA